jgi:hypothetical protein
MPTLVTTPGSASANSYCSVSDADAYHAGHLYASTWNSASVTSKESALLWATRLLDEQVDWFGTKTYADGALRFPRLAVFDRDGYEFDGTVIPGWLENATAELARWLMEEDRTEDRVRGISYLLVGDMALSFDRFDEKPVVPPSVVSMVKYYGEMLSVSQSGFVKVERT